MSRWAMPASLPYPCPCVHTGLEGLHGPDTHEQRCCCLVRGLVRVGGGGTLWLKAANPAQPIVPTTTS